MKTEQNEEGHQKELESTSDYSQDKPLVGGWDVRWVAICFESGFVGEIQLSEGRLLLQACDMKGQLDKCAVEGRLDSWILSDHFEIYRFIRLNTENQLVGRKVFSKESAALWGLELDADL